LRLIEPAAVEAMLLVVEHNGPTTRASRPPGPRIRRPVFGGAAIAESPLRLGVFRSSIKVEMEDICDWPTDMMISVQPDGDSWKVVVMQEGSVDDADRREMVEQISARLRAEYDLKG
jgi:hypothetical protein